MGARTSVEMVRAMELVRSGMSGYAAAKQVGIELSTLYRSALWKAYKAELESTQNDHQADTRTDFEKQLAAAQAEVWPDFTRITKEKNHDKP